MDSVTDLICHAIHERRLLEFRYRTLPRVVEPMAVGQVKSGEWQLRAHQVDGKSSSSHRLPDGTPRMFRLGDMTEISVLQASFDIPKFYTRGDQGFIRIAAEL